MKRYIDLFTQHSSQKKSVILIRKFKKIGFILMTSLFVLLAIEWGVFLLLSNYLSDKEKIKNRYYSYVVQNQETDSKIKNLLFKYQILQQFYKDDLNVDYYYNLLNELLSNLGSARALSEYNLNPKQEVAFSLTFDSYGKAVDFLNKMESQNFVDYFDRLALSEFSIGAFEGQEVKLEFSGKFKPVQDAKPI